MLILGILTAGFLHGCYSLICPHGAGSLELADGDGDVLLDLVPLSIRCIQLEGDASLRRIGQDGEHAPAVLRSRLRQSKPGRNSGGSRSAVGSLAPLRQRNGSVLAGSGVVWSRRQLKRVVDSDRNLLLDVVAQRVSGIQIESDAARPGDW